MRRYALLLPLGILSALLAVPCEAGVRGNSYTTTVMWEHGSTYEDCLQYHENGSFVTSRGSGTYIEVDLIIFSIVRGHYDQNGQFVNLQGLSLGGGAVIVLFGQNVSTFELVNAFGIRGGCPIVAPARQKLRNR